VTPGDTRGRYLQERGAWHPQNWWTARRVVAGFDSGPPPRRPDLGGCLCEASSRASPRRPGGSCYHRCITATPGRVFDRQYSAASFRPVTHTRVLAGPL